MSAWSEFDDEDVGAGPGLRRSMASEVIWEEWQKNRDIKKKNEKNEKKRDLGSIASSTAPSVLGDDEDYDDDGNPLGMPDGFTRFQDEFQNERKDHHQGASGGGALWLAHL